MDTAYEIETQKFVKAWSINRDSSYIKPEEDIFIADKNQIENYDEVIKNNNLDYIEVRYKRGHLRNYVKDSRITFVTPHFFIPNRKKYGVNLIPESPEHKKIKTFLWKYFYNNDELELIYSNYKRKGQTETNKVKIKDLPINFKDFTLSQEDVFEVNIMDTYNTRRVDLFLKFDDFNPLFGEGIVIEVQLSKQSDEITKKRTLDRALKGYSTIWIDKRHFIDIKENDLELLDNKIFINSWHSVIHNSSDNLADELYEKIKKYSRLLDTKIANTLYPQVGMICPVCKKGQMVERESKNKNFLGCSKYPECLQTYSIVILDGGYEE